MWGNIAKNLEAEYVLLLLAIFVLFLGSNFSYQMVPSAHYLFKSCLLI